MTIKLEQLLDYDEVAIQCHDYPDADAIASGFALYRYFSAHGKDVLLFYGGAKPISKPNLAMMRDKLGIPLSYLPELKRRPGLLITVDCQFGGNNVQRVEAETVAVIDHHQVGGELPPLFSVKPQFGACATLVERLLSEAGFELTASERPLVIALYYGLYSDTNAFTEIRHPYDLNLRDKLTWHDPNKMLQEEGILKNLLYSNLALEDLELASGALANLKYNQEHRFALIEAAPCDPNILGFISDLANQVDCLDSILVWNKRGGGYKFSVRGSGRNCAAIDLARWLTDYEPDKCGGHREKAGGWIEEKILEKNGGLSIEQFFNKKMVDYHHLYQIIDCGQDGAVEQKGLQTYRKNSVTVGYVPSTKLFKAGVRLLVRMLEGEVTVTADDNLYLMIGVKGEIYFNRQDKFLANYYPLPEAYEPPFELAYAPTVSSAADGEQISILDHALKCQSRDTVLVKARRLERPVKVFPLWSQDKYLLGEIGDWLLTQLDNPNDAYIVTKDVFNILYSPCESQEAEHLQIRDFSSVNLALYPDRRQAISKPIPVTAFFTSSDGEVKTLEGVVSYRAGAIIMTGPDGEKWPIERNYFLSAYTLVDADTNQYVKKPLEVLALQVMEAFSVRLEGGTLKGRPGDWLVEYEAGRLGVVAAEIFKKTYELI